MGTLEISGAPRLCGKGYTRCRALAEKEGTLNPTFWSRYRIRFSYLLGILLIFSAHPRHVLVYFIGLGVALSGQALRLWSSGVLDKNRYLVQSGPYAIVRHPLYLGSSLIAFGAVITSSSWHTPFQSAFLWILCVFFCWRILGGTAKAEDEKLRAAFPEDYDAYSRKVPMFLPRRESLALKDCGNFQWSRVKKNKEIKACLGLLFLALILWTKLIYRL